MRFSGLDFRLLLALPLLASCSVLREEARGTYDPDLIVPGASKEVIDAELGTPRILDENGSGQRLAVYKTSRVYAGAPSELAKEKLFVDVYTLGIAEIINGFGLADHTRRKEFHVLYDPDTIAKSIDLACFSKSFKDFDDPQVHRISVTGTRRGRAICADDIFRIQPDFPDGP